MTDDRRNPIDQAVDLFVYAPIGVAMFAKDTLPSFVKLFIARGHTELDSKRKRVEQQVHQYKTLGRFAVQYGGPEVRRQAEEKLDGVRRRAEETFGTVVSSFAGAPPDGEYAGPAARPAPRPEAAPEAPTVPARPSAVDEMPIAATATPGGVAPTAAVDHATPSPPRADSLAIPDYDELSASQVVERLEGLANGELAAVEAYESAHRGRRTILGKIEQLRA